MPPEMIADTQIMKRFVNWKPAGQRKVWLSYELEAPASESVTSINTRSRFVLVLSGKWLKPGAAQLGRQIGVALPRLIAGWLA
jgi:hypothetical protein